MQRYRNRAPCARRWTSNIIKNFFQLRSLQNILFIEREKNSVNNPYYSGSFFRICSSHVNLNWLVLLQANLGPFFFGVNGVVTKLKNFGFINAGMAASILCNFGRHLGKTQLANIKRLRKGYIFACLLCRAQHSFCRFPTKLTRCGGP